MKINKITTGFVIQTWDTKKKKWLSQEFVAGDECVYEDEEGIPVDPEEMGGHVEPYLPFEMVQPH
jgi:hypothetical protein